MKNQTAELFRNYKVCVLIPTYNNASTVGHVLRSVLAYTDQVIVVNDGSSDNTQDVLKEFGEIKLVSYDQNVGKGLALRKGFEEARKSGYDYCITIDSDGQHFADDLPVFLEKLEQHKNTIIIGARNMEQAGVPGRSSFGNKFSNFWVWVETGLKLPDTQSGFRLYPLRPLETISFYTKKYEFEIEVLVRSAWRGVDVIAVPVKVAYPEDRVSHFRPFKDVTRITILNTVMVVITFLYIKPRDFFRGIKKKTFTRSCVTYLSGRVSPTE